LSGFKGDLMALCRCLESHAWPTGRISNYISYALPIGYPDTALICGLCSNPGVIWLTQSEENAYQRGDRIFEGPNAFCKMKASDSGLYQHPTNPIPTLPPSNSGSGIHQYPPNSQELHCEHIVSLSEDWVNEKLSCINVSEGSRLANLEALFNQKVGQEGAHLTPVEFSDVLRFKGLARSVQSFNDIYVGNHEVENITGRVFQSNLHIYTFEQVIGDENLQQEVLTTAAQLINALTQLQYVGVAVASAVLRIAFPQLFGTADWIVPGLLHCRRDDIQTENPFISNLADIDALVECLSLNFNGNYLIGSLSPYQSRKLAMENYPTYVKELWSIKQRFALPQTIAKIEMSIWSYGICYVKKQDRQDNLPFRFRPTDAPSPPIGGPFSKRCPNI
jgi:hypothetical protein